VSVCMKARREGNEITASHAVPMHEHDRRERCRDVIRDAGVHGKRCGASDSWNRGPLTPQRHSARSGDGTCYLHDRDAEQSAAEETRQ
jgi:hypothetical protein